MKFRVTFKDPDGVYDSISASIFDQLAKFDLRGELSEEIEEHAKDGLREELEDFIRPWVKYGEYITIEFDTETKTAVVVPNP